MIENVFFHDFIMTLAAALDARDPYTMGHSLRVAEYSCVLASDLEKDDFDNIHIAAHLHDIGKIGIRDNILLKCGKLTDDEFRQMEKHSIIGYEILSKCPPLEEIAVIVRHHHERFDGLGYPDGIAGETIPFGSRIIAVADALDAMTSLRPYRNPIPFETAIEEIVEHSGEQFDPHVTKLALNKKDKLLETYREYRTEIDMSVINLEHKYVRHSSRV